MRHAAALGFVFAYAVSASAQEPVGYRPHSDTLTYAAENSYLMYFVQAADTMGRPVATRTREDILVSEGVHGLQVWVRLRGMGEPAFEAENSYTISRSGRVLLVNGREPTAAAGARVDLLPRFPELPRPLPVGAAWQDTVSVAREEPWGSSHYRARRSYEVVQVLDSLDTRLLVIVSRGELSLRQGGWQDPDAQTVWWQEVSGPVVDSLWFDPATGVLVASSSVMDLEGNGGFGTKDGTVTMPSGLRSRHRRVLTAEP